MFAFSKWQIFNSRTARNVLSTRFSIRVVKLKPNKKKTANHNGGKSVTNQSENMWLAASAGKHVTGDRRGKAYDIWLARKNREIHITAYYHICAVISYGFCCTSFWYNARIIKQCELSAAITKRLISFLLVFFKQNSTFHSRKWRVQPWSSRVSIARTENTRDSRRAGERQPLFRIASEVTEKGGARHRDGEKRDSARDKKHATCKKPPIGKRAGWKCT